MITTNKYIYNKTDLDEREGISVSEINNKNP